MTRTTLQDRINMYELRRINELRRMMKDRGLDIPQNATKRQLAEALGRYAHRRSSPDRMGSSISSVRELMVGDVLRNRWNQRMTVERIENGAAYARHGRFSSKEGQIERLTDADVVEANVTVPADNHRFWSDYEKEGGHHIM